MRIFLSIMGIALVSYAMISGMTYPPLDAQKTTLMLVIIVLLINLLDFKERDDAK